MSPFRTLRRMLALAGFSTIILAGAASAQTGGALYFNRYDFSTGQQLAQLWQVNPNGTGLARVPANLTEAEYPILSRDGRSLSVSGRSLLRPSMVTANVFLLNPLNGAVQQVTQLQDSVVGSQSSYTLALYKAFSPEKGRMAVASYDSVIITGSGGSTVPMLRVVRMDGFPLQLVAMGSPHTLEMHVGDGVDWMPGRELIAWPRDYTTRSGWPATGLFLFEPVTDADGQGRYRQLTFPGAGLLPDSSLVTEMDFQPSFSPDGRQVAYVRNVQVNNPFSQPVWASIRVVNSDGTGDRELIRFRQGLYVSRVTWSPDGTQLAFDLGNQFMNGTQPMAMMDRRTSTVHLLTLATGAVRQFLAAPAGFPSWNAGTPTVPNPAPAVTTLSPASVPAGSAARTLTVNGTGFVRTSQVRWNGTALTTQFVSATRMTAAVPANLMATGGTFRITVASPTPGGGTSNAVNLTVVNPRPTLTTLTPASVKAGSAGITLTVNGSGFVRTSKVRWNGVALTTTYVTAKQLRATVPAARLAVAGAAKVTVFSPTPGGGVSNTLTFTINP